MFVDCLLVCRLSWKCFHFIAGGPLNISVMALCWNITCIKRFIFIIRQSTGFTESIMCTRSNIFHDCFVCLYLWDSLHIVEYTLTGPSDAEHLWRQSRYMRESIWWSWSYWKSDSREAAERSRPVWPARAGYLLADQACLACPRNLLTELVFNTISYDYR